MRVSIPASPRHPARPKAGAFSLAELAIIIVILAILGGVAAPRFANAIAGHHVGNAARRVAADLELAKQQAMMKSAGVTVTFNVMGDSYQLAGVSHLDRPADAYQVSLADEPYRAQITSAVFGADSEIVFDGFGVPDSGGSVVVQVGIHQETVVVDADAGRIGVQ